MFLRQPHTLPSGSAQLAAAKLFVCLHIVCGFEEEHSLENLHSVLFCLIESILLNLLCVFDLGSYCFWWRLGIDHWTVSRKLERFLLLLLCTGDNSAVEQWTCDQTVMSLMSGRSYVRSSSLEFTFSAGSLFQYPFYLVSLHLYTLRMFQPSAASWPIASRLDCIVPMGFLPWEIQVAFPGESQQQQSHYPAYGACWVF